jgi:hypothetical protein
MCPAAGGDHSALQRSNLLDLRLSAPYGFVASRLLQKLSDGLSRLSLKDQVFDG